MKHSIAITKHDRFGIPRSWTRPRLSQVKRAFRDFPEPSAVTAKPMMTRQTRSFHRLPNLAVSHRVSVPYGSPLGVTLGKSRKRMLSTESPRGPGAQGQRPYNLRTSNKTTLIMTQRSAPKPMPHHIPQRSPSRSDTDHKLCLFQTFSSPRIHSITGTAPQTHVTRLRSRQDDHHCEYDPSTGPSVIPAA